MKFIIEIPAQGSYVLRDIDDHIINEMDSTQLAQKLTGAQNQIKRAETLTMTCLKTNSGIVIIGGRAYYIP